MGAVYRALDRTTGAPVALKVLRTAEVGYARRFASEVRVLADLAHPAIVRYVAHGETDDGSPFFAMEWLEGLDLQQRQEQGGLPVADALTIAARAAEVLAFVHARGVVHRDIKPSNLFLRNGDPEDVVLLDFGIARAPHGVTLGRTATAGTIGTLAYMAPEQARGTGADARADLFALGCVLFELLCGRPAFAGEHGVAVLAKILFETAPRLRDFRPQLPPALDDLVASLLAKDPAQRPASAIAVVEALAAIGPVQGAPPSLPAPTAALTGGEQRVVSIVLAPGGIPSAIGVDADTLQLDPVLVTVGTYGGHVELLLDGSVVVVMADQRVATDQAAKAARCALAVRERLPDARLVMATGRAVLADGMPLGDAIERAADLAARAPALPANTVKPPIVLDDVTAGLLDARFDVRRTGDVFLLAGEGDALGTTRTLLGRATPFVGREREMSTLEALFDESCAEPVARVILVTGGAGAGKSRLRQEAVRAVTARANVEVLLGSGDQVRAAAPFALLEPLVRRAAQIAERDAPDVARAKLRARVARHVAPAEVDRVADFLGEATGVRFPDETRVLLRAARADPQLLADHVRRAWIDFLGAECAARPVLVILEDAHWGDLPSFRLVDAALRALADRPLFVLAFARPDIHDAFPRLFAERDVQEIRLSALTRKAAERLAREVLGPMDTGTLARVIDRAQGNAFYLEELLRAVAEGNQTLLPETVVAMVQARLEALEPDARRVLRAASIFGERFWRSGVQALLGSSTTTIDVRPWLDWLAAREVVHPESSARFPGEDEYAFRHALLREGAYGMLTDADRSRGHAAAGAWLESAGERDAQVLADHFARGGDTDKAALWYARAAEHALEANDLAASLAHVKRGLDLGAAGPLRGSLKLTEAIALRWGGSRTETAAAGLEAMSLLTPGSIGWCRAAEATSVIGSRGPGGPIEIVGDALLEATPEPNAVPAYVWALGRLAFYLGHAGEKERVRRLYETLDAVVARLPSVDLALATHLDALTASRMLNQSEWEKCLRAAERAVQGFEALGDARGATHYRVYVGDALRELGVYDQAERGFRLIIDDATSRGVHMLAALCRLNLACTLGETGRLDEALEVANLAYEQLSKQEDRRLAGSVLEHRARIYMLRNEWDLAEKDARRAVDSLDGVATHLAQAHATLAHVLLRTGRASEALAPAAAAYATYLRLGRVGEDEWHIRAVHAEALHASGADEDARTVLDATRRDLDARLAAIDDPALRQSYARVSVCAHVFALASRWGT
jgi:tetratricopeptide (TPR) repeat protein